MEELATVLPIIIYFLLIILLVVGIILGIKIIITIDKVNVVVDDLTKKIKTLDGVFNLVDAATNKVGYLTSIAMKDSENVGYLSTYDTPFDKKILYGFMQGQKDLNRSGNIVVKHFEEEENYNKTLDYTKEMFKSRSESVSQNVARLNNSTFIER